jgi:hypothetical protein
VHRETTLQAAGRGNHRPGGLMPSAAFTSDTGQAMVPDRPCTPSVSTDSICHCHCTEEVVMRTRLGWVLFLAAGAAVVAGVLLFGHGDLRPAHGSLGF